MQKQLICLIIPTTNAGGTENYVLRLIPFLKKSYEIIVISVSGTKGELHQQFEHLGVKLLQMPTRYVNLLAFLALYLLFKKCKFFAVCNFNGDFAGISIFLAARAGVKKRIVFYRRSSNAFRGSVVKNVYRAFVNGLVRRYATSILSNSKRAFENFFPKQFQFDARLKVIANGVDSSVFDIAISKEHARGLLGLPNDVFIIGNIGRIDPAKNHDTILDAASRVLKKQSKVYFLFCGKDTDSNMFKSQVQLAGIGGNSFLLGTHENVPVVLRACDLFLFPSLTEGQPNALIEAMISGLPIITSNIDSIKEIMPRDSHDKLVSPLDAAGITNLILTLMENVQLRKNYVFKEWAKTLFDYTTNFRLVENEFNEI